MSHAPLHLFMTTDALGGVWTYAQDLAVGLLQHGIRMTIGIIGPRAPLCCAEQLKAKGISVIHVQGALDWLAESESEIQDTADRVFAAAKSVHADLLLFHTPSWLAFGPAPCPALCVTHSCVASWHEAVRGNELPRDLVWRSALVARGLAQANINIAPSRAFAQTLARLHGCAEPITIHNGHAPPIPSRRECADFIFTSGRLWDEGKGLAILDAAAADCIFPVIAAGATQSPFGNTIRVRHIGLRGHLRPDRLHTILARRPLFCSAALYEPFGLSVLEAAQHGCALVLSNIPTFQELWQGAALFVPPRDPAALSRALNALSRDHEWRTELGKAAAERARLFAPEKQAAQMAALCQGLLRHKSGRAA